MYNTTVTANSSDGNGADIYNGGTDDKGEHFGDGSQLLEPISIDAQESPVFWGCDVTPQAVAEKARVELMITHKPAQMFVTDLPREGAHTLNGVGGDCPGGSRPYSLRATDQGDTSGC
jgi:uncharacterized protein YcsI (UPF0317 family)